MLGRVNSVFLLGQGLTEKNIALPQITEKPALYTSRLISALEEELLCFSRLRLDFATASSVQPAIFGQYGYVTQFSDVKDKKGSLLPKMNIM